ncbi:hypothetical protein BO70DRAFT_403908 [Aspergillus heteromorphus CBS 117.55]|uniref:Uncharacterized protein n=1 Tax=Aspergillus heteromorphus CBS 117.55 TaxID=1448321 RepID=A0A317WEG2_9EURO|nr:uncharacterized protein BO70DRAFT_403908 [Aspergillus heteromorphus CBS 117.55]PWY83612.1 hypothetical protein BO70DRAFT_403908 [Aspergillus heteromorphus CBS 117.55]
MAPLSESQTTTDGAITQAPSPDSAVTTVSSLKDPSTFPGLWYRIHVLIFDLRNFNNPSSNKRLDRVIDPSFIGAPYFDPMEGDLIKNTVIDGKQLTALKRVESGDFRVCAAHDLAPVIGRVLGIDLKQLEKDEKLPALVEERGLNLQGEDWTGLEKMSFSSKKKNKKKKKNKR